MQMDLIVPYEKAQDISLNQPTEPHKNNKTPLFI